MKVLVTGGGGFIGSHLVDRLVKESHEVVVLDNLFRGKKENINQHISNKKIDFIEGDIRNFEQVLSACQQCEVVFHLAAQSNVMGAVDDIEYSFSTNVVGTFNVLRAAKSTGVRRVIFTSSREAYGEAQYLPVDEKHPLASKNSYGASKAAGEVYCRVFQDMKAIEVVVLRLANVYGTRDFGRVIPIFLDKIKSGKNISIFGGQQIIDFIAVPTIIETLMQSIKNDAVLEGPVNVGSGKGLTLYELADTIADLSGKPDMITVQAARDEEVVKYTADVTNYQRVFNIPLPKDPLAHLKTMAIKKN